MLFLEIHRQAIGGNLDTNRIKSLEEEQEVLTSSLLALTSHFAQVQFRLRQIVDAPTLERDRMLKNLEEFAFRGIPEMKTLNEFGEFGRSAQLTNSSQMDEVDATPSEKQTTAGDTKDADIIRLLETQKARQFELMKKLKEQLHDLERSDSSLKFDFLTTTAQKKTEDLGYSTLKMKQQLVRQLKSQISELERFTSSLQEEAEKKKTVDPKKTTVTKCRRIENRPEESNKTPRTKEKITTPPRQQTHHQSSSTSTEGILSKTSSLLQMFALTQFGCGRDTTADTRKGDLDFQRNILKKTTKFNHWGDIRAQLEIDIQEIVGLSHQIKILVKNWKVENRKRHTIKVVSKDDLLVAAENTDEYDDDDGDDEQAFREIKGSDKYTALNAELTTIVRKNFAITLKKLIQHGLYRDLDTSSIVPFIGCFSSESISTHTTPWVPTQKPNQRQHNDDDDVAAEISDPIRTELGGGGRPNMMADDDRDYGLADVNDAMADKNPWELILEYYHLKKGDAFNDTPARKLSQSFNMEIVGGAATTNKQSLLSAIGSIISVHSPYRRSHNAHFKAFVCAGLNANKLCQWLNLIFQCRELVSMYYTDWSYVAVTGFRDAFKSMERLAPYHFELPVDLAIKQFQNIKDVFM